MVGNTQRGHGPPASAGYPCACLGRAVGCQTMWRRKGPQAWEGRVRVAQASYAGLATHLPSAQGNQRRM